MIEQTEYIEEPLVLVDEQRSRCWVGGPTEVLPDLDEALAALPFDEWRETRSMSASLMWMVPDHHEDGCAFGGGPGCGCWKIAKSYLAPSAEPFWEFDFNASRKDQ